MLTIELEKAYAMIAASRRIKRLVPSDVMISLHNNNNFKTYKAQMSIQIY